MCVSIVNKFCVRVHVSVCVCVSFYLPGKQSLLPLLEFLRQYVLKNVKLVTEPQQSTLMPENLLLA